MNKSILKRLNHYLNRVSKQLGLATTLGYPTALMVEPTNYCNLSCVLCPTGAGWLAHTQGRMEKDRFYRLIDEAGPYLERVAFWNWGEPFLHNGLLDMVRYTRRWSVWLQVCTNGHFFNDISVVRGIVKSGLNQIIVAMDGFNDESVQRYRGLNASHKRILSGLQNLLDARDAYQGHRPLIEVQFLVMRHNQEEVEPARKICEEMGVDRFYLKTINMRQEDLQIHADLLPDDEKFRRFERDAQGNWKVKGRPTGVCPYVYDTAVVLWDGSLVPCCYDAEEKVILGNAFHEGFKNSWNSRSYRQFRYRVRHQRASIPMCSWCPEERRHQRTRMGRFWTDLRQVN